MLSLAILAVLTGILTALLIRRTTNAVALRETRNRMQAHLLEFRLFFDEPSLIWQAQIHLLRDNGRLFRLLLPPTLLLALPMSWLFLQLEAVYGLRPLPVGEPAIVTAQLTRPIQASDRFELKGAETPAIRIARENQVVWRICPTGDGILKLGVNGRVITKTVVTGAAPRLLSPRRSHSLVDFVLHPEEPRLPDGDLAWIEIAYPHASAAWLVWFLITSTFAALLTARFR